MSRLSIKAPPDYVFRRDACSYGYFLLMPNVWSPAAQTLTRPLHLEGGIATFVISQKAGKGGDVLARCDRALARAESNEAKRRIRRMLNLDDNGIRAFHKVDPRWKRSGRGRLFRSPTLFEDIIKTVTSCNVAWTSTIRMNERFCEVINPAFPTDRQLARRTPGTLRARCGVGYRDVRMVELAKLNVRGVIDEQWYENPRTSDEDVFAALIELPGIGPYTAAAIMAIAFDKRATVVDGNVERVISRIFAIEKPLPHSKPVLKELATSLTPHVRPGDYAQAIMDLGATVCKPKSPQCSACPWQSSCRANHQGIQEKLPQRMKKSPKPRRHGTAFWLQREDGKILLRKRAPSGLLGAMMEIPSSPWIDTTQTVSAKNQPAAHAPIKARWQRQGCEVVKHTFTHFHLEMTIWQARADMNTKLTKAADEARCSWVDINELDTQALPTLMRKIVNTALGIP